jgi:hypothetical protein
MRWGLCTQVIERVLLPERMCSLFFSIIECVLCNGLGFLHAGNVFQEGLALFARPFGVRPGIYARDMCVVRMCSLI